MTNSDRDGVTFVFIDGRSFKAATYAHSTMNKSSATRILICAVTAVSASFALGQTHPAIPSQQTETDGGSVRFCVVPVKDGAPTEADVGQAWRISSNVFRIPGLPALVLTPINRGGQWTIDAGRRLVRYATRFPGSYLDDNRWVVESWSGRAVALPPWAGKGADVAGISVIRPGSGRFEALEEGPRAERYGTIQTLPRRRLTIVVSEQGIPYAVGDNSLRPWLSPAEMAAHRMRGLYRLYDVPALSAVIVIDTDYRIHVLTDDDEWHDLDANAARDSDGRLFEIPSLNTAFLISSRLVMAIKKSDDKPARFSAETLLATAHVPEASLRFLTSNVLKQVLTYDRAGFLNWRQRWRRLGPTGFADIDGGDIGNALSEILPYGQVHDLPTHGKALIEGARGLYLYDGVTFTPVTGGEITRLGNLPQIYDLQSIKRVLVSTQNGMFELPAEGKLVSLTMPFPADGLPQPAAVDWPEAGVALISTRNGLFALNSDLNASPVTGGDQIKLGWLRFANGTNPGTGEMVITSTPGLFLVVDSRRDPETCR